MPKIEFKQLKFKNFMSYGNKVQTIDFDNASALITGKNGYGKSTIFMALFYALYGKTYKKVKLSSLVNNVNLKEMYTEISFSIQENNYIIKRGIKPNIFEIYENDKLIDQSASVGDYQEYLETYILKIPEHVFKQLIFFGANVSGNKTFMELSKSEKEQMFSTITDTSIFGLMRDNINQKIKETKTKLTEINYKQDVLKQSIISEQENIKKMEEHNIEANAINSKRNESSVKDLEAINIWISDINAKINKLKVLKPKYDEYEVKAKELQNDINTYNQELRVINNSLEKISITKKSFSACIGCAKLANISDVDISKEDEFLTSKASLDSIIEVTQASLDMYKAKSKDIYDILIEGKGLKETLLNLESQRDSILVTLKTPSINLIEIDYLNIEKQKETYKKSITLKEKVQKKQVDLASLLKLIDNNNLKGVILNQQLPILNKYINLYLSEFSSEFKFNFVIDQNFKENLISKSKEFELHSLSNGYNLRLTFSIMFAFLKLVQERSGIDTNILVLDEALDSALDKEGREELLSIIRKDFSTKTIFVISHNDEIKNNIQDFDKVFIIENDGYSTIREI